MNLKSIGRTACGFSLDMLALPLHLLLGALSLVVKRDPALWVIGSWRGVRFADNGKWFLLQAVSLHGIRPVLLTRNREVFAHLRALDLPVAMANSLRGWWIALRAGVYAFDSSPTDASWWAIHGAYWVQMWHGIPLKRIERDIDVPGHPMVRFCRWASGEAGWLCKLAFMLRAPWFVRGYDMVCSTSPALAAIFSSAFGVPESAVRVLGYPRNDAILNAALDLHDDPAIEQVAALHAQGKKIVLYVPTFREDGGEHRNQSWDEARQQAIDQSMRALDAIFLVKLHPAVQQGWSQNPELKNLRVLPSALDLYSLLRHVDVLVTDYSSIYFDFLLLDRPIVFYCYDLDKYIGSRGLYFDYEQATPGPRPRTFEGLVQAMEQALRGEDVCQQQRRSMIEQMHVWKDAASARRLVDAVQAMQRRNGCADASE
jgi:CDP-glycerol glycerophosphotransferase (TagB/SpsB family)